MAVVDERVIKPYMPENINKYANFSIEKALKYSGKPLSWFFIREHNSSVAYRAWRIKTVRDRERRLICKSKVKIGVSVVTVKDFVERAKHYGVLEETSILCLQAMAVKGIVKIGKIEQEDKSDERI